MMSEKFLPWVRLRRLGLLTVITTICLLGCVHRIDIQQGNFLEAKDVDRVTVGMTRIQVRALLGTPMVADPFTSSRWDYVYYLKRGRWQKPEHRHFIVFFDSEKVNRIDRSDKGAVDAAVSASGSPAVTPSG